MVLADRLTGSSSPFWLWLSAFRELNGRTTSGQIPLPLFLLLSGLCKEWFNKGRSTLAKDVD